MAAPTIPLVVTALAAAALYAAREKKPKARFLGDLAEVGDEAAIPVSALKLPLGIQIPQVALYAIMKVEGQDAERVQGRIVAGATAEGSRVELPELLRNAIDVQTVARSAVTAVYRKGMLVKFPG